MDYEIKFSEQPRLFILEYYDEKKNQIDLNCETECLKVKDEVEQEILNELRFELLAKIDLVKQLVLERYDSLESKLTVEMLQNSTQQVKDEIFVDCYCVVLEVYPQISIFELKIGVLLFSEFTDGYLDSIM